MTVTLEQAMRSTVFREIDAMLRALHPPVILKHWIKRVIKVHTTSLGGIDFEPTDAEQLLATLTSVKDGYGDPAFTDDSVKDPTTGEAVTHGPLRASFGRTEGKGLRQVYRPRLSDRPLVEHDARSGRSMDRRFAALFGPEASRLEMSSLHWGVGRLKTNVHIDQTGFVMALPGVGTAITPDTPQHLFNELFLKTDLGNLGPTLRKIADRVSLQVPNSANGFDPRLTLSVDLVQKQNYKVTFTHSCELYPDKVCYVSGEHTYTLSVSGKHDIFGGGRR